MREKGLHPAPLDEAQYVIVNACTVTEGAERELRRILSRVKRDSSNHKEIIIVGCHSQVYPQRNYGANLILGQKEKFSICEYLGKSGIHVGELTSSLDMEEIPKALPSGPRTRFFFKIQDGCDRFCSYCIVPYARGRPRSRPVGEILEFLRRLKEAGFREVVLCGIEIASYHDPVNGYDLKGLLELLEKSETPERIRLSSIDPLLIDEEFIKILRKSKKICKSIHIPLQSASDRVLEMMGRKYTSSQVKEMIEELTTQVEGVGIGLDVIVGFPGESEKDFLETVNFIESLPIYYLHVFPFSPREGTQASKMTPRIEEKEKRRRVRLLKEIDGKLRERFWREHLGERMRVLFEKKVYEGGFMRGYTENYIPVYVPYSEDLVNEVVFVKIERLFRGRVFGQAECA